MWASIALWFLTSKTGRAIAAIGALTLAIGFAVLKAFSAGKESERIAQDRQSLDNIRERQATDAEVEGLGHADVDQRLDRWMRK
jgi:hypothetical protein